MKILKKIGVGLLLLLAVVLLIAVFIEKNYTVERTIVINQPKDSVYAYLKLLKNQDNFSKWASMDLNAKKSFKGTDGNIGFISRWESEITGIGEQEIMKLEEGKRIDWELRFKKPIESVGTTYMTMETVETNKTKLVWSMSGNMAYPTNVMLLVMDMDKMLGADFDDGLNKLKSILEKK